MKLVKLDIATFPIGRPLPFVLRGGNGVLLAAAGYVIQSRQELELMELRGMNVCVDTDECGEAYKAYITRLHESVREGWSLGQIAAITYGDANHIAPPTVVRDPAVRPNWDDLQVVANSVLRSAGTEQFRAKFNGLHADLTFLIQRQTDATLFALIQLSASHARMYSATHAMMVCVVCMLTAKLVLRWADEDVARLGKAALSMNISMTELQDQLAQQSAALSTDQINQISSHSERSAQMLESAGIDDPIWLDAVRRHHDRDPGPLAGRPLGQQMARLMQRADILGARMAPRASRTPMASTAAMQASYFDEHKKVDEAGAALIKALGMYVPGSYVKLANGEVGVVLRRGATPSTPRVAVVLNKQGMATAEPMVRDTANANYKIAASLAARDVKTLVPLDKLLSLI